MNNDMPTPYYGLLYEIDADTTAWATKHQVPRVYLAKDVEALDLPALRESRDRFKERLEYSQAYADQMRDALLQLVANPDHDVHRVAFHALMPVAPKPESSDSG